MPLAHQGGWDEILVFAVPIALYAIIRWWERRRGDGEDADVADGEQPPPPE